MPALNPLSKAATRSLTSNTKAYYPIQTNPEVPGIHELRMYIAVLTFPGILDARGMLESETNPTHITPHHHGEFFSRQSRSYLLTCIIQGTECCIIEDNRRNISSWYQSFFFSINWIGSRREYVEVISDRLL